MKKDGKFQRVQRTQNKNYEAVPHKKKEIMRSIAKMYYRFYKNL